LKQRRLFTRAGDRLAFAVSIVYRGIECRTGEVSAQESGTTAEQLRGHRASISTISPRPHVLPPAAVELATGGAAGCEALQKAINTRYAGSVRRSQAAKDPHGLQTLGGDALKDGDIAPAYRAVMTHPQATLGAQHAIAT
jgi:hypothetical protein